MTTDQETNISSQPFISLEGDMSSGLLLLCDHASPYVPESYNSLGLSSDAFKRHIAYDIGVEQLTKQLNQEFGAPAVLSQFSRLLIDPNRGEDDPTLIMKISDGQAIPVNVSIDDAERSYRQARFYDPYHTAISRKINDALEAAKPPVLLSIHSFTPVWRGVKRPWEGAVLWDNDPRFAVPFLTALREETKLNIGENEPYTGRLRGDCMYKHGTSRGLAHCLLEIRQDLLQTPSAIAEWCEYIRKALLVSLQAENLHEIKHFGSLAK